MEEKNIPVYEDCAEDEIDVIQLLRNLFGEWRQLLKWALIGLALGVVVAASSVKTYTVTTKMTPEIAVKSSGSSLGSLANLAGVNIGGISGTDAISPDIYPSIVQSIPFKVELFSLPVEFKSKGETVQTDLYDYLANYTKISWFDAVKSFPKKAIKKISNWVKGKKTTLVYGHENADPYNLTSEQSKVSGMISSGVAVSLDKKTGIITTTVTMQNPQVTATLATAVMDKLQEYVSGYRTGKARHDLAYFEQLRDSARNDYFNAQQKYARYVDSNQGVILQRVKIEQERLQNEMNLKYQLYNQTEQQVQAARAKVQQDTPVCAVIQPSYVPKSSLPSVQKILVIFVFLAVFLEALWILWGKDFLKKLKEPQEEQ